MDLIPTLTAVLVVAVLITIVIAVFTYIVFKLRERRSPERLRSQMEKKRFFKRYSLNA